MRQGAALASATDNLASVACHCERVSLCGNAQFDLTERCGALARLLGQLSMTATFDGGRLHAIIDHEATELLVARVGDEIVGMATFVSSPLPTGLRGQVEDVVVEESMRGRGIARKLLETMTTMAGERGLRTLDLTSRPSRESALQLYEGVGFRRREPTSFDTPPSEPRSSIAVRPSPARYDRAFAVYDRLPGRFTAGTCVTRGRSCEMVLESGEPESAATPYSPIRR